RALTRPIEKVITYANRSNEQLTTEVSEYIVTERMEINFQKLLEQMQAAQRGGGGHEIGVWVSGFYGSGKSSFTKYLGFALDRDMKIDGEPFLGLLRTRLHTDTTRATFTSVANVYDAAVIFLDLASEMLAGASMADVSTVLYLKTLKWAGYSEDLKVADLERMLEKDGKLEAFHKRAKDELEGTEWSEAHNQPLVANSIAGPLAHEFYPSIFKTATAFNDLNLNVNKPENERVQEMLDLIRAKSGKKTILFVIDEVGQYVSAKEGLILNLDGLAKNLKQLGNGNAWIFATAQQTLTEDNPTAAINSPGLYKLKDRFPIQVHLEASDIKEICHKRLLTKSATGEKQLGELYESHGASLRTATQLTSGGVYQSELNKKVFVDLYPFLPAHFEILLQLLARLAKKTGGLGLRSAIKVIQEVLIERLPAQAPLADAPVGKLATTVTFYDSMQRDIQKSYPHVVEGVERVVQRLPGDASAIAVAKSIAILQILDNLPVTAANVAALMQPDVTSLSHKDEVDQAISRMLADTLIPLDEKDGRYRFLTQAAGVAAEEVRRNGIRPPGREQRDQRHAARNLYAPAISAARWWAASDRRAEARHRRRAGSIPGGRP
ncbi:MAG: BREX system P-loop protein BrxC, partial [Actinobacteria bacterium]|nr:BREX system P-loop protein BrxC [Actinomycetota bacterium]